MYVGPGLSPILTSVESAGPAANTPRACHSPDNVIILRVNINIHNRMIEVISLVYLCPGRPSILGFVNSPR